MSTPEIQNGNGGNSYSLKEMVGQLLESVKTIDRKLDDLRDQKADKRVVDTLDQRMLNVERYGTVNAQEALKESNLNSQRISVLETLNIPQIQADVRNLVLQDQKWRELVAQSNVERKIYETKMDDMQAVIKTLKSRAEAEEGVSNYKKYWIPIIISATVSVLSMLVYLTVSGKIL